MKVQRIFLPRHPKWPLQNKINKNQQEQKQVSRYSVLLLTTRRKGKHSQPRRRGYLPQIGGEHRRMHAMPPLRRITSRTPTGPYSPVTLLVLSMISCGGGSVPRRNSERIFAASSSRYRADDTSEEWTLRSSSTHCPVHFRSSIAHRRSASIPGPGSQRRPASASFPRSEISPDFSRSSNRFA